MALVPLYQRLLYGRISESLDESAGLKFFYKLHVAYYTKIPTRPRFN